MHFCRFLPKRGFFSFLTTTAMLWGWTEPGVADSWRLAPALAEVVPTTDLHEEFPSIDSPRDLQELLIELSYLREFSSLEARYGEGGWLIDGQIAVVIGEFFFRYDLSEFYELTESIKKRYTGELATEEMRGQIINEISENLTSRGYPNNNVTISSSESGRSARYTVAIAAGEPCIITAISSTFTLPRDISLEVKAGDICHREHVNQAVNSFAEALLKKGYGEANIAKKHLAYSPDGRRATLQLEGFLGRKTTYLITNIEQSAIERAFNLNGELPAIDRTRADPLEFERALTKRYIDSGYFSFAIVSRDVFESPTQGTTYHYTIAPGPIYGLGAVQFVGDLPFAEQQLESVLDLKTFSGDFKLYKKENIDKAREKLLQFLADQGYWHAEVSTSISPLRAYSASLFLQMKVDLKQQNIFRSLKLSGNRAITSAELHGLADFTVGAPLRRDRIIAFEEAVSTRYARHGFNHATVEVKIASYPEKNLDQTDVVVTIKEGIRERIGNIKFVGLETTHRRVITRELRFAAGEWLDNVKINQTRNALLRLGIFSEVRINPLRSTHVTPSMREIDLIIEVKEGFAGSVVFGPGYDLNRGLTYMAQVSYNNLFGTGRRVSARTAISQEIKQTALSEPNSQQGALYIGRKINLGFFEPYVFSLPADGAVSLTHQGTAELFHQINNIIDLSISYKPQFLPGRNTITPFTNFQVNKEEGTIVQEQNLVATPNSKIFRSGLRLISDQRNELGWPTSGFFAKLTGAWATYLFHTDYQFFQWYFAFNHYWGMTERVVWVNGISLAAYDNILSSSHNNLLPASERLLAGGAENVRGFTRQLGPYVLYQGDNTPIGGSRRLVLKSDLRYKISDSFGSSLFIDGGNSFFSAQEIASFYQAYGEKAGGGSAPAIEDNFSYDFSSAVSDPQQWYARNYFAYGLSVSYLTPLGPFVGSIAWPWHEPESENCRDKGVCYARGTGGPTKYLTIGTEF